MRPALCVLHLLLMWAEEIRQNPIVVIIEAVIKKEGGHIHLLEVMG